MATESKSPMVILRNFFGMKAGQTLQEFAAEVRELSEGEKRELVTLAAVELGVDVDWNAAAKKVA